MIGNKDINSISGIPNENYFITNYYDFINKKPHSKLIMIDLNNFKSLNDTFGHNVGDYYLIYFSKLLLSTFNDDLVARLHGDEFVIVTNKSDKEITDLFINCIEFIKQSASFGTLPRPFTFSAGSYTSRYIPSTLRNITITDATIIRNGAFSNIRDLNSLNLGGANLTTIENGAFYNLDLDDDVNDDGIVDTGYVVASSTDTINHSRLVIPSTVTTLGSYLLYGSNVRTLVLPASITSASAG